MFVDKKGNSKSNCKEFGLTESFESIHRLCRYFLRHRATLTGSRGMLQPRVVDLLFKVVECCRHTNRLSISAVIHCVVRGMGL